MHRHIRLSRSVLSICIVTFLLCVAASGCNRVPEASFELANESRLPVWFRLSPEQSRTDVSVTMKYYVRSTGRSATFILHDAKGHVLGEVKGTLRGTAPITLDASARRDGTVYPSFEIITAEGVAQLIEHKKMEPIFYVVDDPVLFKALTGVRMNEGPLPAGSLQ